jgi:hypothetical protein
VAVLGAGTFFDGFDAISLGVDPSELAFLVSGP